MDSPLLPTQAVLLGQMEDDAFLDYTAMSNAWAVSVEPGTKYFMLQNLRSKTEATVELLKTKSFVIVKPSDYTQKAYRYYEALGEGSWCSFDSNNVEMECTARHPGTTMDGDVEEGVDPVEKYPNYIVNEQTSPITTVAADGLYSVAFAGPSGIFSELKAAYPMQLSARIDEARRCFNLDCFEYKPSCIMLLTEKQERPIPINADMKRFEDCFALRPSRGNSAWDSDEESFDYDDDVMQERAEPLHGASFSEDQLCIVNYQATAGKFAASRCLRVRIPLPEVVGVRLMTSEDLQDDEKDHGAVLIIEIQNKLGPDTFAARKVHSRYTKENSFAIIKDWTPNRAASQASRFYVYGTLAELKQAAALIAKLCPHLASMLTDANNVSNTLMASVSAEYDASPSLKERPATKESPSPCKGYKMTVKQVHTLLAKTSFVKDKHEAKQLNPCAKKAILLGYIEIDESTDPDEIIHKGRCPHCDHDLDCRIHQALWQKETYGGSAHLTGDYYGLVDGIFCEHCEQACFITGLCKNQFDFDNGKFHNHCTECPDFGICLGDHRMDHCEHCDGHYYAGNYGFPCRACGNGKDEDLTKMKPPPTTVWDGEPENANEVMEAILTDKAGQDADFLRAMILGDPEGAASSLGNATTAFRDEASRIFGGDIDGNEAGTTSRFMNVSPEDILLKAFLAGAASTLNMDQLEGEDKEFAKSLLSSGGIAEIMAKIGAMDVFGEDRYDEESE